MTRWQSAQVSICGTHHLLNGKPLYAARFDQVLAFHAPGLAAVRLGESAWHVDTKGRARYARRFQRTFGYYEERAAVVSDDGWHHIRADGEDLYRGHFAWCGNYQGGRCTVRTGEGNYRHLDPQGYPAYDKRWRYAGDFRDGAAVVQEEEGRSSHIDPHGEFLHGRWFLDLDVFHKGFARARDEDGWMHVDRLGRPIYARRFAMVEPFYNGQARVERLDGALEVIDEEGTILAILRGPVCTP